MAPDQPGDESDSALESHVRAPTTDKPNTKRVDFSVDTSKATVKADDETGYTTLRVPVSSLNEDRDGDKISADGMESLVAQVSDAPVGLFPNHGMDPGTAMYDFREVFGAWEGGELEDDTAFGEVRLLTKPDSDELMDDGKALKNLIEQDAPVGFSIGFGWDEKDAEELENGGMRFNDLDLMEISAVGIPSNPSAVVQAGTEIAASVKDAGLDPAAVDTDRLTKSLQQSMSSKENDDEDEEEEEQDSEQEQEQRGTELDEETLESIQSTVQSVVGTHADAIVADVMEALADGMDRGDDEETDGADEGDEEEEETESADDDEDDEKAAEIEELRAELETLKSDVAESAGKKGGMTPAEGKGDRDDEEPDADSETKQTPPDEWAEGLA